MQRKTRGGGRQSPFGAQNQAAACNGGGGDGLRATREWGEYDKVRRRGLPYGTREPVTDGNVLDRMKQCCSERDGDMRWPQPGFVEHEAALTGPANSLEFQKQRAAGYNGPVPHAGGYMAPKSPFVLHLQRCHQSTQQAAARDQQHARDMQRTQREYARQVRLMELNAQRHGWGS